MNNEIILDIVEHSATPKYKRRSDEEIAYIAKGIVSGSIYCSFGMPINQLASVFLCIGNLNDFQKKELVRDRITHFYQETNKSLEWSSMIFVDHHCLDDVDSERVMEAINHV